MADGQWLMDGRGLRSAFSEPYAISYKLLAIFGEATNLSPLCRAPFKMWTGIIGQEG